MSTIMFLDPEIAAVGLNETMAQRDGIAYRAAVYDYSLVSRAIAMGATNGWCVAYILLFRSTLTFILSFFLASNCW